MTHQIALNFEDGVTRIISCNADETVLKAAYRQQVNLPMDCSDGVCGTCKCRAESGSYDLGEEYIEDALSADEAEQGLVLTCQMRPATDCVIAVPVPSTACKLKPAATVGEIRRVELVSASTILLELALETPVAFLAGQYVSLEIPGTRETRAYSFSSAPGADVAQFLIRNVPGGRMSGWLTGEARPGVQMKLWGPLGSFFLRPAVRPLVMLAGGTGLAPLLSMLEVLAGEGSAQEILLVYGTTFDRDLVEMDRLAGLQARLPGLRVVTTVVDAESSHPNKGYVTAHLPEAALHGGDCDVYLCGPPPMVEAVRVHFAGSGIVPVSFRYEKFAPSETAAV